jgi:hypothetical protein
MARSGKFFQYRTAFMRVHIIAPKRFLALAECRFQRMLKPLQVGHFLVDGGKLLADEVTHLRACMRIFVLDEHFCGCCQ